MCTVLLLRSSDPASESSNICKRAIVIWFLYSDFTWLVDFANGDAVWNFAMLIVWNLAWIQKAGSVCCMISYCVIFSTAVSMKSSPISRLPFSSVFCSSVVLVSVFLFCQIGHDFINCYLLLLLAYVLRNPLQVLIFWSMQENLHRATMYVIDHLSNEMQQGVETLCEYRGGGLFFLCFFFCRCREARRSRSFQTLWSRRDDVAMH